MDDENNVNTEETAGETYDPNAVPEEQPQEVAEDPAMQQADTPQEPMEPEMEPDVLEGDNRDVKLFDYFVSLKSYIEILKTAMTKIEQDQLSTINYNKVVRMYGEVKKEIADISFYMDNNYEYNDYKKNLYTYLLYNKKLADIVAELRSVTHLNQDNEKEK